MSALKVQVLKVADIERLENTSVFVAFTGFDHTAQVQVTACCCSISSKFDCCIGTIIPTSV